MCVEEEIPTITLFKVYLIICFHYNFITAPLGSGGRGEPRNEAVVAVVEEAMEPAPPRTTTITTTPQPCGRGRAAADGARPASERGRTVRLLFHGGEAEMENGVRITTQLNKLLLCSADFHTVCGVCLV